MKKIKKLLAVLLTGIMICAPATVFAEEAEPVSAERQDVVASAVPAEQQDVSIGSGSVAEPASLGTLLASSSGTIYNGSGTISFTLPSGNWWADFIASIGYTTDNSPVSVSVKTPEGKTFSLGNMCGTGGTTPSHQETYAPAGTYTFYFVSANPNPFEVAGFIHD